MVLGCTLGSEVFGGESGSCFMARQWDVGNMVNPKTKHVLPQLFLEFVVLFAKIPVIMNLNTILRHE